MRIRKSLRNFKKTWRELGEKKQLEDYIKVFPNASYRELIGAAKGILQGKMISEKMKMMKKIHGGEER